MIHLKCIACYSDIWFRVKEGMMSGIEIIGLVLGTLPLAIEALKCYRTQLSRWRSSERDLKALIRDLETEHIRLQTTCEVLLDGIVPASQIDELVAKPFGPAWRQFDDKISARLWTAASKFKEQAGSVQEAVEELKTKLGLKKDGKASISH